MTINVPNPEVLQAAFANIQANLVYWNQEHWISLNPNDQPPPENTCGTTACLAGHIMLSQGVPAKDLFHVDVEYRAMRALGFELEERLVEPGCSCCDAAVRRVWSSDGEEFQKIFYVTEDPNSNTKLEYNQDAFNAFKAYVSEQTGVEL